MLDDALRKLLQNKPADELRKLCRKRDPQIATSGSKDEIIDRLLEDTAACRRQLMPTWWNRYSYHVYGGATIVALIIGILALPFWWSSSRESTPNTKAIPFRQTTSDPVITLGGKHFLESSILLEMMAIAVEKKTAPRIEVERKHNFRETIYCREALLNGEIDGYAEYTGTVLTHHLGIDISSCRGDRNRRRHTQPYIQRALERSPRRLDGLAWIGDFGLHNGYAIVMRRERLDELGLRSPIVSISEIMKTGKSFDIVGNPEAFDRDDCLEAIIATYEDLRFDKRIEESEHHMNYELLVDPGDRSNGNTRPAVDMAIGFTTDTQLNDDFIPLHDDRSVFVHYFAGPLMRKETLERFRANGIRQALESLLDGFMRDGEDRFADANPIAGRMRALMLAVEDAQDDNGKPLLITPRTLEHNPAASIELGRIVERWMRKQGLL